jgi:hypothetical protein
MSGAEPKAAAKDEKKGEKKGTDERLAKLPDLDAHCTNGTVLRLKVLDEKLTIKTPFGKLVVPLSKVKEIEFATRIPPETEKRISDAIKGLSDDEPKKRERAAAALARMKLKAYPALLKLENAEDAEVKRAVGKLLEALRKEFTEEQLEVRKFDVIRTENSKISGEIEGTTLLVNTEIFGENKLKLMSVRRLTAGGKEEKVAAGPALPDPGNLYAYQMHVGKTFTFTVTGAVRGTVYGTDKYTLDSSLATAALHAGVVKLNETKNVTVRILGATNNFVSSMRNGVTSTAWPNYPGAYEFVKKGRRK